MRIKFDKCAVTKVAEAFLLDTVMVSSIDRVGSKAIKLILQ